MPMDEIDHLIVGAGTAGSCWQHACPRIALVAAAQAQRSAPATSDWASTTRRGCSPVDRCERYESEGTPYGNGVPYPRPASSTEMIRWPRR